MKTRIQQLIRISTPATIRRAFALATVAIAISTSSFATGADDVNFQTLQSFRNTFINAKDVQWVNKADYNKASFLYEGERMEAYFDLNGELIGTSKAVSTQTLPAGAVKKIKGKYSDYAWKEVIQFTGKDNEFFYVSLSSDAQQVVLQISKEGNVSVFKSTKK